MLHVADGFSESDCGARDGENGGTIRRDRSGGVGCERTGANRRDVSDRIYECRRRRESLRNARDKNAMAQVLNAMKGASSLEEIVRLDTCITVVDCSAFNGDITTPEDLCSRFDSRLSRSRSALSTPSKLSRCRATNLSYP